MQKRVFAIMGLGEAEAQEKFGFLLDAFKYGAPPHGGIAFGWDRIVALLAGTDSIRDVIAFPKSGGGYDPLTAAPAPITPEQRKEAGVDAVPEAASRRTAGRRSGTTRKPVDTAVERPYLVEDSVRAALRDALGIKPLPPLMPNIVCWSSNVALRMPPVSRVTHDTASGPTARLNRSNDDLDSVRHPTRQGP